MTVLSWFRNLTSHSERSRKRSRSSAVRTRGNRHRLSMERLEDRCLLATFTVLNADDSGAGSLRQAILDANANPNVDVPDLIAFNIAGQGVHTIDVGSDGLGGLPGISDPVTIDGYSQPGASPNTLAVGGDAVLQIELDGTSAGPAAGLEITAGSSTIRGLVINRFELAGISLRQRDGNVIEGNFLGTDASGAIALGNEQGVRSSLAGSQLHTIGGTTPAARNIISGNRSDGVFLDNSARLGGGSIRVFRGFHQVQGNYIGTDVTGSSPLGNAGHGVHLFSTDNTVGGQVPGAANTIAFNGDAGVHVRLGLLNSILSNSIHSNAGLGISSTFARPAPVLTEATSSAGTTTIEGTLTGQANATFIVEFFSNSAADPSGFGEGETFLGSALVTTDDAGNASYQVTLPAAVSTGHVITATATAPTGTTSRFSEGLLLTNLPPVNTVPGDQVAAEDVAKAIGGLSVFDDDAAGVLTVTFAVEHGTLTVDDGVAGGLAATDVSGNGTAMLTLSGTQAQINATLADLTGLTYLGTKDFSGQDTLWMTTTDAGGLSDADVFTIDVLSAQQQAELLVAIISDLEDDGVLNGGQENSLIKKLSFLSRPHSENIVRAFIQQVNAFVLAGILTQEQGDELTAAAESIIASLA